MSAYAETHPIGQLRSSRRRRFLQELERPIDALAHIGPNWFGSVMGTGIVANAAVLLPVHIPGIQSVALGVWLLTVALLVGLVAATVAHWILYPENARGHHHNPASAPFYGMPPMALMTVGSGALLVGKQLTGAGAAITIDEVLWTLGTVTGLLSAVAIPYLLFTEHEFEFRDISATWLLAVVPPMVSALTGPALIAHLPAGQDRLAMLLACLAMFGISLFASMIIITLLWARLALHGVGPQRLVPTLWVVLGPLGSSIAAVGLLAAAAPLAVGHTYATALDAFAVIYGLSVWGFAMAWLAIAAAITVRALRAGLPFSLTWWSFTFPVGTVVLGTSELALRTHAAFLTDAAVALYVLLVLAWITAAVRTTRGAFRGGLFVP
ncbi:MAG: TDT family transporter [Solirubrobacteraceae bacterium]